MTKRYSSTPRRTRRPPKNIDSPYYKGKKLYRYEVEAIKDTLSIMGSEVDEKALAKEYGVNRAMINHIKLGRHWSYV